MSKNIGIVCEGPTDYVLLKGIVDQITGEDKRQPCGRLQKNSASAKVRYIVEVTK
jgi:hypothetical protein